MKQLRRQQGLKDDGPVTAGSSLPPLTTTPALFPPAELKGEWYFYNTAFRTKGQADFKARWGTRPNQDNWRRFASVTATAGFQNNQNQTNTAGTGSTTGIDLAGVSYDGLYAHLPLTPERLQRSNDSIANALFLLGNSYVEEIEDCSIGTETFEQLRNRFPGFAKMDEVLFKLYYCYNKNGETTKAADIKKLMGEKYAGSNFNTIITTGKNPQSKEANKDATKAYEKIYDLFVEGNFAQAVAEKKAADSLYGPMYWTPQLLYIEAVYYIRQREDSTAKEILNALISKSTGSVLASRATTLLDVLGRRKQIEDELSRMTISRQAGTPSVQRPIETLCQAAGAAAQKIATIVERNIRCCFAIGPQNSFGAPAPFPTART